MASPEPANVAGWGGGETTPVLRVRPEGVVALQAAIRDRPQAGVIARGMGRSYGDAAQLCGGLVLDTTGMKRYELDGERGIVTAEAGVTLYELLDALVPAGWMVPVVPGTQHVTVGGAIASDIHGKNHGAVGTFGMHVEAIGLMDATGEIRELVPGEPDGLFEATLGGMGLTGVIVSARVRLRQVSSAMMSVDSDRVGDLDEAFDALRASGGPHRVAWIDLLSRRPGRGIVTRAEHLPAEDVPANARGRATVRAVATVPARWPHGILRPATVLAHNELRYRLAPRRVRGAVESIGKHMFPLDVLNAWPRLYGPAGFVQYQFVVPYGAEQVVHQLIARLRRSRVPCFLAVLKDFGPVNDAPLSFPLAGWTLTLDLPRSAPALWTTLDQFDELVAGAGGRVYLSKDARLRPAGLPAMYPRLGDWRAIRDRADPEQVWCSDLALRAGLIEAPG